MDPLAMLLGRCWAAVSGERVPPVIAMTGEPTLASVFPVSALASASVGAAALAEAALRDEIGFTPVSCDDDGVRVVVDRPLADRWFRAAVAPVDWEPESPWDALAGDYRTADGWIRLHTNAPHHRAAALRALWLRGRPDRTQVADAVSTWKAQELEDAVVAAGGAAAMLHTHEEWLALPAGRAVAAEPLIAWTDAPLPHPPASDAALRRWRPTASAPLAGMRVLDLTRVIAGPVATRHLAGLGATVLRIDPPTWSEAGLAQEMTLGKVVAGLDLDEEEPAARLAELVSEADVVVHGYRPGAMESLGLGSAVLQRLRPGVVEVALDAYGWSGPWRERRGFDSLVQCSIGIAAAGMLAADADAPVPLPVQALDHATGWLTAAAVLEAVRRRVAGSLASARLSLAATGMLLASVSGRERIVADAAAEPGAAAVGDATSTVALEVTRMTTPWGAVDVAPAPASVDGIRASWSRAPRPLRSDAARWPAVESRAG